MVKYIRMVYLIVVVSVFIRIGDTHCYGWSGETWASIDRATIAAKANEMMDSSWTPRNNIYNWGWGSKWNWFYAGTTYHGVAYCQNNPQENWNEFSHYVTTTSGGNTYYGNDCSGFVSIAWRLPTRYTTWSFESDALQSGGYCSSLGAVGSGQNVSLEKGDAFNDKDLHIILFNRYVSSGIESMEQTPWLARRRTWTWSQLSGYRPIRRNEVLGSNNLCGNIGGRSLTAGTTYTVTCDIRVDAGQELIIQKGAVLNDFDKFSFTVNGKLTWGTP